MNKAKTEALASVRAHWLPIQNAFRTINWDIVKQELKPFIDFMSQKNLLGNKNIGLLAK